ncbi:hypothetical protein Bca4012_057752 [Brassica carinata]
MKKRMANDSSVLKWLLLFLQLVFLIQNADSASIVKYLPGFDGPLPFELETGYIGVGENEEVQLFYYFIKSERNPGEDPLLLWLSGGPGCSSISGLLFENGPLAMKLDVYNGTIPPSVSTTYSWTKPVGTGFSYSRTHLVNKPSDSGEAKRIHEFLQKWLVKHQEFSSNPFYAGGDSYSGKIVPALVQEISKGNMMMMHAGNYQCCNPPINLQGYVLGNPLTEEKIDSNHRIPYAHGMAFISDELYEESIGEWVRCKYGIPYTYDIISSVPYHKNNSINGYPSLIFSGDHDMEVPYLGTQAWIRSLNYSIIDDWRPWMINDQIAGEVGTRQSTNQMKALSCFKGGSMDNLCRRGN